MSQEINAHKQDVERRQSAKMLLTELETPQHSRTRSCISSFTKCCKFGLRTTFLVARSYHPSQLHSHAQQAAQEPQQPAFCVIQDTRQGEMKQHSSLQGRYACNFQFSTPPVTAAQEQRRGLSVLAQPIFVCALHPHRQHKRLILT